MDADSLKFMLDIGETIAVEFKRCGNGITNDVYETVQVSLQGTTSRPRNGLLTINGAMHDLHGAQLLFIVRILEKCSHTEYLCGLAFRRNPEGFPKGAAAPFGTQPLEQRCSVLYLPLRLAGKMRVSQGGHTHFIQQENVQVFVNGNKQKPCSVSVSGGG